MQIKNSFNEMCSFVKDLKSSILLYYMTTNRYAQQNIRRHNVVHPNSLPDSQQGHQLCPNHICPPLLRHFLGNSNILIHVLKEEATNIIEITNNTIKYKKRTQN